MVIRLTLGIHKLRLKVKPIRRKVKRRGYVEQELWYKVLGGSWPGCISDLRRVGYPVEMIEGEVWFRPKMEEDPELVPKPQPKPQLSPFQRIFAA